MTENTPPAPNGPPPDDERPDDERPEDRGDAPKPEAGAEGPPPTPSSSLPRAQRLQKLPDSGRNLVPPGEAAPPPLRDAADAPGSAPRSPDASPLVPPTREYDVPLTERLDKGALEASGPPVTPLAPVPPSPAAGSSIPPTARSSPSLLARLRALVPTRVRVPARLRPDPAKLRRRLAFALVLLLALRLVIALTLDFALDTACRELLGLKCSVGSSSLRLLSGQAVFEGLELATPGGQPVATVGRAELDVSLDQLPAIVIHRAVLEDPKLKLRREADGSVPALRELAQLLASKPGNPSTAGGKPPRVVLEAVRVTNGRFTWEDLSTTPPLSQTLELSARADNLALDGSPRALPASVQVRLAAPGILDSFYLDADADQEGDTRSVRLKLELEGHPRELAAYLAPHVVPKAENVSLDLAARLVLRRELLEGAGLAADLTIDHVRAHLDSEEIGFDRLVASARKLTGHEIEVSSIAIDRPRFALALTRDHSVSLAGIAIPLSDDPPVKPVLSVVEGTPPGPPLDLPRVVVDEVAVHGGTFRFSDETTEPPVVLGGRDIEVSVRDLVHDEKRLDAPARLDVSLGVDRGVQTIRVSGTVVPFATPRTTSLAIDARGLTLEALAPWLARGGLEFALSDGVFSAKLDASEVEKGDDLLFSAALEGLTLTDGTERARIPRVTAEAALDPDARRLAFTSGTIERPRVRVEREPGGALAFAGLRTRKIAPAALPPRPGERPLIRRFELENVALSGLEASFVDRALPSPLELALEKGAVSVSGIALDITSASVTGRTPARLHAGALIASKGASSTGGSKGGAGIGELSVDVSVVLDPAAPALSGSLVALHVSPRALAPYFEGAGLEPALEDGRLEVNVEASARTHESSLDSVHVAVSRLALTSRDGELAALDRLDLEGGAVGPGRRELGTVTVDGARAHVTRLASGATEAFGLRFVPGPVPGSSGGAGVSPARDRAGGTPAPPSLPGGAGVSPALPLYIHWGEVNVTRAALALDDATVEPEARLRVSRLDASLGERHFDHEDLGGTPPVDRPAPFKLHAEVEDAVAALDLVGGIVPSARAPVIFGDLHAEGVTLRALEPYLAPAGLVPELARGEVRAHVEASALVGEATRARFLVRDLACTDGPAELAGLDRGALDLELADFARRLTLDGAVLDRPRVLVERSAAGSVSVLGLRLVSGKPAPVASGTPLAVYLDGARVEDLSLRFRDDREHATLDLSKGRVEVAPLRLGAGADAAPFTLHAEVAGVGSLDAAGGVRLDAAAPLLSATLALRHLRGKPLDPYVRDVGRILLEDGALDARLLLARQPAAEGGSTFEGALSDLELREGTRRLLAWRALHVEVPRAAGEALLVDELALGGLEGQVRRFADGRVQVAGLELLPRARKDESAPPATEDDGAVLPPLPRVEVKNLGLEASRVEIEDGDAPGTPPFVVQDLHVSQPWPFLLPKGGRSSGFLSLVGSFGVKDVLGKAQLRLQLVPFDSEPHAALELELDGFAGPAFVERVPALAPRLDASALTQGSLRLYASFDLRNRKRLDAILKNPRATPLSFDASITDLDVRATPDGPTLLGFDELHVDMTGWNLATGEARLRAVELANPRGRLRVERAGLRFLDTVFKPGPARETSPAPDVPGPEVKIDRIAVTDGELLFEDGSVTPEFSLPFGGLEAELTGFTSRALRERRPLRVTLAARSGAVFEELTAQGMFTLSPQLDGDADAQLVGLRVPPFKGLALRYLDLKVVEGRIDVAARARARNGRLVSLFQSALTDCKVDEPPASAISRASVVRLPAALAVLRNDDGVVFLPVPWVQQFDGLRLASKPDFPGIVGTAITAAVKGFGWKPVGMAEDVAKTFAKAVTGPADGERSALPVGFQPADSRLPPALLPDLKAIAGRLKADANLRVSLRAEVGSQDEERARKLGAPSPAERRDLIARLEARRVRLEARRADAEALVRAALLSGSPDEVGTARARHAGAARAVQDVDRGLDALYDQERDARGRSAETRTRDVASSLCDARVEAVRAFLVSEGVSVEQIRPIRPRLKPDDVTSPGRVVCELQVTTAK